MVIRLQGGGGGYNKSLQFLSLSFVLTQKKQKVKTQLSRSEIFFLLDQFTSCWLFFNGLVEYANAISQKVVKT
jgi:hypothetical protein